MNNRDLKNIKILCDYWSGEIEESEATSRLILKQTTEAGRQRYIKKLITIIKTEEVAVKARRAND